MDGTVERPVGLQFLRVRMPLVTAHRSAQGEQHHRESVVLRWVAADGVEGWAECPTLSSAGYATETTDQAWVALATELGPAALAGRSPSPVGAPAAAAALADAALDARLRAGGESLSVWLARRAGLPQRDTVAWCAVLADVGLGPAEAAEQAVEAVACGAVMVKLKVDGGAAGAVARVGEVVAAVRDAVAVPVAADANGSLTIGQAVALDDLGLAYLEQSLPAGTPWEELASLRRATSTPLALDESITSLDSLRTALLAGALDLVSVKPARIGGGAAAAMAAAMASQWGVGWFVGGMFELGLGRAAALAVASLGSGAPGAPLPTDLGPSARYVLRDICEPLVAGADGRLVVPTGAGSGRIPDMAALRECTVEEVSLGAV